MRKRNVPATTAEMREVLDYFGKCPECGYPAKASATLRDDGTVLAYCDRPCGWSARVPLTTMTTRSTGVAS
jgi:hypothetical protein